MGTSQSICANKFVACIKNTPTKNSNSKKIINRTIFSQISHQNLNPISQLHTNENASPPYLILEMGQIVSIPWPCHRTKKVRKLTATDYDRRNCAKSYRNQSYKLLRDLLHHQKSYYTPQSNQSFKRMLLYLRKYPSKIQQVSHVSWIRLD